MEVRGVGGVGVGGGYARGGGVRPAGYSVLCEPRGP